MKASPLLDFWDKPDHAGEPVALLASTFALEPDFFERDCLARFLAVSSVEEETGSVDDTVAKLELEEKLRGPSVTILADRSTRAERSSFHWDLLHCHVDTGLLHSKVAVLLWENATRVIIGSANLTAAGYRRQIELALAADLGPACLLPAPILAGIADELESYLALVDFSSEPPAVTDARATLTLLRSRISSMNSPRSPVRVALAPTNPTTTPMDSFEAVWKGSRPLRATQLSPFWDSDQPDVLSRVRGLLTGHPARARRQRVAVTLTPTGGTPFPTSLHTHVDAVRHLALDEDNIRLLHAKCLLVESDSWVAALVGSSNHTKAGFGLTRVRHRELNVWLGAPAESKEGKALASLVPMGAVLAADVPDTAPIDEDETATDDAALPLCFGLCHLGREDADNWVLAMEVRATDAPPTWTVATPTGALIAEASAWTRAGQPEVVKVSIATEDLPLYLVVRWESEGTPHETAWTVLVKDRHQLPPGLGLVDLRSEHLLRALASGKSLSQVVREELERHQTDRARGKKGVELNPLKRLDDRASLFRRGRALAQSLAALERRLSRPVLTLGGLAARLQGPLGPSFVARKVCEECEPDDPGEKRAEAIFTVAEIALVLARVEWTEVLKQVDETAGRSMVRDALTVIDDLRSELGGEPPDVAAYGGRAIEEAVRCVS